mmetsp:Transcript_38265/g.110519  ORF Transcript_38265/g.110519 Transcript_38265/m.110519 type:complete len:457 (-) Transcript_38265:709-2079(-)
MQPQREPVQWFRIECPNRFECGFRHPSVTGHVASHLKGGSASLELNSGDRSQKCAIPRYPMRRVILFPQLAWCAFRPANGPALLLLVALLAGVVAAPGPAAVLRVVAADRRGVLHLQASPVRPELPLLAPVDARPAGSLARRPAVVLLVAPAPRRLAAARAAAVLQVLGAGSAEVVQAVAVQLPRLPRGDVAQAELAAVLPGLVAQEDPRVVEPLEVAVELLVAGAAVGVGARDGADLREHQALVVPLGPGHGLLQAPVGAPAAGRPPAARAGLVAAAARVRAREGRVHVLVHVVGHVLRGVLQRREPRVPRAAAARELLAPAQRARPLRGVAPVQAGDQYEVAGASLPDRVDSGLRPLPPKLHQIPALVRGIAVEVPLNTVLISPVRLVIEPKDYLVIRAPLSGDSRPQCCKVTPHHVHAIVLETELAIVGVHDHVVTQVVCDEVDNLVNPGHEV